MAHIEYEYNEGRNDCVIRVRLDGRVVGAIKPVSENKAKGWQYFPKGQEDGGDVFKTVAECQRSVEGKDST